MSTILSLGLPIFSQAQVASFLFALPFLTLALLWALGTCAISLSEARYRMATRNKTRRLSRPNRGFTRH